MMVWWRFRTVCAYGIEIEDILLLFASLIKYQQILWKSKGNEVEFYINMCWNKVLSNILIRNQ